MAAGELDKLFAAPAAQASENPYVFVGQELLTLLAHRHVPFPFMQQMHAIRGLQVVLAVLATLNILIRLLPRNKVNGPRLWLWKAVRTPRGKYLVPQTSLMAPVCTIAWTVPAQIIIQRVGRLPSHPALRAYAANAAYWAVLGCCMWNWLWWQACGLLFSTSAFLSGAEDPQARLWLSSSSRHPFALHRLPPLFLNVLIIGLPIVQAATVFPPGVLACLYADRATDRTRAVANTLLDLGSTFATDHIAPDPALLASLDATYSTVPQLDSDSSLVCTIFSGFLIAWHGLITLLFLRFAIALVDLAVHQLRTISGTIARLDEETKARASPMPAQSTPLPGVVANGGAEAPTMSPPWQAEMARQQRWARRMRKSVRHHLVTVLVLALCFLVVAAVSVATSLWVIALNNSVRRSGIALATLWTYTLLGLLATSYSTWYAFFPPPSYTPPQRPNDPDGPLPLDHIVVTPSSPADRPTYYPGRFSFPAPTRAPARPTSAGSTSQAEKEVAKVALLPRMPKRMESWDEDVKAERRVHSPKSSGATLTDPDEVDELDDAALGVTSKVVSAAASRPRSGDPSAADARGHSFIDLDDDRPKQVWRPSTFWQKRSEP